MSQSHLPSSQHSTAQHSTAQHIMTAPITLTACLSNNLCSLHLRSDSSILPAPSCIALPLPSSIFLAVFLSTSALRLCPGVDEVCDKVPNNAPNNLRPRFLSSALVLSGAEGRRGGERRARFGEGGSEAEGRRFRVDGWIVSSGSGMDTADAIMLGRISEALDRSDECEICDGKSRRAKQSR